MCGNGIRCLAKYVHDHALCAANPLRVQTAAGIRNIDLTLDAAGKVSAARVDMGEPVLRAADIPAAPPGHDPDQPIIDYRYVFGLCNLDLPEVEIEDLTSDAGIEPFMTCVSMGNPHVVFYCRDVQALPLDLVGPHLECNDMFPERINVHFVQVHSGGEVTMRTWERGSGITLACGTGASAVCVAGVLTARTGRQIVAHLPGGDLELQWSESDNHVYMTGPAVEVFSGTWLGRDDVKKTLSHKVHKDHED